MKSTNITWHEGHVTREDRIKLFGHKNKVLWFTGLSASGKSTLAVEVEKVLVSKGIPCYSLDGDNVRHGLNKNLGFSAGDREENIRRIAEVTKLFYDAGLTVLVCFISPYKKERQLARDLIGEDFIEVFVNTPIEECEKRDPKGLYKKARKGEIKGFTGIDDPYEAPEQAEIEIDTTGKALKDCVEIVINGMG